MTGQQDQPTLPATSDQVTEVARALPGRPGARMEPAPDGTAPRDHGRIDNGHASSVNKQLLERLWRLPPGHPSSPYDGDGKLRPPVPDYRQFERPLPGEEEYDGPEPAWQEPVRVPARERLPELANEQSGRSGAHHGRPGTQQEQTGAAPDRPRAEHGEREPEPGRPRRAEAEGDPFTATDSSAEGDAAADTWPRALPGLQDMWQKHEEKWPESERPPADRSQDEPGSWRGKSSYLLTPRDNKNVENDYTVIARNEERITAYMRELEQRSPGQLVGIENRLKQEDRFKEKVATQKAVNPDAHVHEVIAAIGDGIRYTLQYDDGEYSRGVIADVDVMKQSGYELLKLKNMWERDEYRGINSQWRYCETDQTFEVQFHTSVSFDAKQLTHKAYERIRVLDSGTGSKSGEADELHSYQRLVSSLIPTPFGALDIPDYP